MRDAMIEAARKLSRQCNRLKFADPITHVYNPLDYAWSAHEAYLSMLGDDLEVIFLGMNPGPWGMAQTGVPFGEVNAVRDWLGIEAEIGKPKNEHPKRPVDGLKCSRSEVSGRRLWGLFQEKYPEPGAFFERYFVFNYCPLIFMESSARNRTPDKLPADEKEPLHQVCDQHLQAVLEIVQPKHAIGVGAYAESCLRRAVAATESDTSVARILHPSPASPAANRGWAPQAEKQLIEIGIWQAAAQG